jgi:SAM-dependent methyltransferase/uncharacterized protein YbaR (Trm112 family)
MSGPDEQASSGSTAVTPGPGDLEYCCPRCKGSLEVSPSAYSCTPCRATYPIIADIPDFRLFSDPNREMREDRREAEQLAERSLTLDFEALVDHYWSTDFLSRNPGLVRNVNRHIFTAVPRSRRALAAIEEMLPNEVSGPSRSFLELGCGSGGFLVAARGRFGHVAGIDIALRWLVMARKRLEEQGVSAQLVCCCVEHLPFRPEQVDLAVAGDVIEHTAMQEELLAEAHRVLRDRGALFAATPNRLSLTKEPHVQLWGLGWLPRGLARRYVARVRGLSYDSIFLRSRFGLARLARRSPFRRFSIELPSFSIEEQEGLSPLKRRLMTVYNRVKDWPGVHSLLGLIGPVLQLVCIRDDDTTSSPPI